MKKTKRELYIKCKEFVDNKLFEIEKTINSNKEALQSETKSSAGDKHETGRAMLQIEMEKAGQQLLVVNQMQAVLDKIKISKFSKHAHLGSVIKTSEKNYFMAISVGKITINNQIYYSVSTSSPIGKLLLGKQKNESIKWAGKSIVIHKIE